MKRAFDFVLSLLGLIIFFPVLLVISILIILDSKGGVFFGQKRVGKDETLFKLIKFRTMHTGSDKKGLLTVGHKDKRITHVGYFLRKSKLDELPQLLNILKGDMSFVGPRPEVPRYVEMYNEDQLKVLQVRPGLTDYASLEYIHESELLAKSENPEKTYIEEIMPAKLKLNQKYIREKSFFTDLKIIGKTMLKIIK